MQIKWLRTALKNLDQEAEYIAKDDPQLIIPKTRYIIPYRVRPRLDRI